MPATLDKHPLNEELNERTRSVGGLLHAQTSNMSTPVEMILYETEHIGNADV